MPHWSQEAWGVGSLKEAILCAQPRSPPAGTRTATWWKDSEGLGAEDGQLLLFHRHLQTASGPTGNKLLCSPSLLLPQPVCRVRPREAMGQNLSPCPSSGLEAALGPWGPPGWEPTTDLVLSLLAGQAWVLAPHTKAVPAGGRWSLCSV